MKDASGKSPYDLVPEASPVAVIDLLELIYIKDGYPYHLVILHIGESLYGIVLYRVLVIDTGSLILVSGCHCGDDRSFCVILYIHHIAVYVAFSARGYDCRSGKLHQP